jgi:hypothetical protein
MAVHAISFRIKDDSGYDNRWSSLVAAIGVEATDGTWQETTSFFVLQSTKSSAELASSLYYGSLLDDRKDLLVVINLSLKDQAIKGPLLYPYTLGSLLTAR